MSLLTPHHSSHHLVDTNKKLETLDEDFINELAGEADETVKAKQEEAARKTRQAKAKLEQRLAAERKKAGQAASQKGKQNKKKKQTDEEEDEDAALLTFAKQKKK